jgi:hypothetical protein
MKRKKSRKQILEDQCDKIWSQCIITRDKTCRVTNSDERLSAHHIRSRTHRATRWHLDNGMALSWGVHFLQKANPERFLDKIIEVIGQDKYDELKRISLGVVNYSTADLEIIKYDLERQLRRLKND